MSQVCSNQGTLNKESTAKNVQWQKLLKKENVVT